MLPLLIPAVASIAAKFAPDVLEWITGDKASSEKAGAVIGKLTDTALGITNASTLDEAEQVLASNPELALKFKSEMATTAFETTKLELADVQNARQYQLEMYRSGAKGTTKAILLWVAILMAFVPWLIIVAIMLWAHLDANALAVIVGGLGGLSGFGIKSLGNHESFEIGTSRTSKDKDQSIAALTGGLAALPAAVSRGS